MDFWERRTESEKGELQEPAVGSRESQQWDAQRKRERETRSRDRREQKRIRAMRAKQLELVQRALQYKVSATAAVTSSHVKSDLHEHANECCNRRASRAFSAAHESSLRERLHKTRVWQHRLHWRYFAGNIMPDYATPYYATPLLLRLRHIMLRLIINTPYNTRLLTGDIMLTIFC